MTIKSFEIPRDKWGTGRLLNNDGTMCCLGHLGRACGITDPALRSEGAYPNRNWTKFGYPKKFTTEDGTADAMTLAAGVNDDMRLSRPEKERQIKVLFASRGIKVTFTGSYPAGKRKV